ncbi:MAG: hypothetical protein Q9221_004634 [Calogaya cf. arnoldii]
MSSTSPAAGTPTSIEVYSALLYYGFDKGSATSTAMPPMPPLTKDDGTCCMVSPVIVNQNSISITPANLWNNLVILLEKGTFTILALESGESRLAHRSIGTASFILIECHSPPRYEVIRNKSKQAAPNPRYMAFETAVRQMHVIRLELFENPRTWEVHGATKAATPAGLRRQLEQLCALNITTEEPRFDVRSNIIGEREGGPHSHALTTHSGPRTTSTTDEAHFDVSPNVVIEREGRPNGNALTTHPRSKPAYAETGNRPQPASTNEQPASLLPSANPPPSITLLPPAPPTSTTRQHVSVLKRKVEEMEAQYNKLEEEEKEFAVRSDKRREQLWQKLRSGNPLTSNTPPHPASLKRKLEELEGDYDAIEKEEEEFMVHCRERKAKLWLELHAAFE